MGDIAQATRNQYALTLILYIPLSCSIGLDECHSFCMRLWIHRNFDLLFWSALCSNDYQMIMTVLYKRLNDTGRNWRHVYKVNLKLYQPE